MEQRKYPILRSSVFLILLVLVLWRTNNILKYKWDCHEYVGLKKEQIMEMPPNSVDVVFVGASAVYTGFQPAILYDNYHIRSYNLGTSNNPPISFYYNILEITERHNPRYLIVDFPRLKSYLDPINDKNEVYYLKTYHYLKKPRLKVEFVEELHGRHPDINRLSYYIPLYRYHDRWKELQETDFLRRCSYEPELMGARLTLKQKKIEWREDYMNEKGLDPLNPAPQSLADYQRLIDFCKENEIEIISIIPPRNTLTLADIELAKWHAEENDLKILDLNSENAWGESGLDTDTDFSDALHVNICGAEKITNLVGKYIHEQLDYTSEAYPDADAYYQEMVEKYEALPKEMVEG